MGTRITTTSACPAWCDPLMHADFTVADVEHRELPAHVIVAGIGISVGRSQYRNTMTAETPAVETRLSLDDGDATVAVALPTPDLDNLIQVLIEYRARLEN